MGRIEYRHEFRQTGGAQYGLALVEDCDILIVYAEAFDRDANPEDFSLAAIIAHERGHQLLARHPRLQRCLPVEWSELSEEVTASLLGSLVADRETDAEALMAKAVFDASSRGADIEAVFVHLTRLKQQLKELL